MAKKPRKFESKKKLLEGASKAAQESPLVIYPVWAKLIVVLFAAGWLAAVVLFTVSLQTGVSMVRSSTDPAAIKATMDKLADFDKLPEGFRCQLATTFFQASFLSIIHEPELSNFVFFFLPPEKKRDNTKSLADEMASEGIPMLSQDFELSNRASMPVADKTMEYRTGFARTREGKYPALVGCIVHKNKSAMLLYAWTPPLPETPGSKNSQRANSGAAPESAASQEFDLERLQSLLSSIKGFKVAR